MIFFAAVGHLFDTGQHVHISHPRFGITDIFANTVDVQRAEFCLHVADTLHERVQLRRVLNRIGKAFHGSLHSLAAVGIHDLQSLKRVSGKVAASGFAEFIKLEQFFSVISNALHISSAADQTVQEAGRLVRDSCRGRDAQHNRKWRA